MTYAITDNCIDCQRCISACSIGAIQADAAAPRIDLNQCDRCEGRYGVPQCWAVCPTNEGCIPLLAAGELATSAAQSLENSLGYWTSWFISYSRRVTRLKNSQQSAYWHHWFETYAQKLKHLKL